MGSIKDDRGYNQGFAHSKAYIERTERRCKVITDSFETTEATALEIGCGTGLHAYIIAKNFPNVKVVGTDICESFIVDANKNYKLDNLHYELLDFNDKKAVKKVLETYGSFDYIFGDGILHHLQPDLAGAVHSLKVLLKKGGKMLFWEPNVLNPYIFSIFKIKPIRARGNLEPQEMAFAKGYMKKILKDEHFTDISIRHRDFLLPVTPDSLIKPFVAVGGVLEKIPLLRAWSQSIFISARKND